MKLKISGGNQQNEEPEDDFLDPSDAELGLVQVSEAIPRPVREALPEPAKNPEPSTIDFLLHLALGAALLGFQEINDRSREKRTLVDDSSLHAEPLTHLDDDQDQLRYAVIGLVLNTPGVISRGASRAAQFVNSSFSRVSEVLKPLTGSRTFRPINNRIDQMVARGERIVGDWVDAGRRGEKTSQALLQQTTDEVVGDLVDMLAKRPEITDLVQQQSVGMVDDLTGELQGRAAAIDTILERIVTSIIPGTKKDVTPTLIIPIPEEEEQAGGKKQSLKGKS